MQGIFTYICHKNQPNVGKYPSPMDPMGMFPFTDRSQLPFFQAMHEKEQPEGKPLLVTMATRQPGEAKGKGKDGGRFCRRFRETWEMCDLFFGNREVEINQFFACSGNYFTLQSEIQIGTSENECSAVEWGFCAQSERLSRKDLWDVNEQPLKILIKC